MSSRFWRCPHCHTILQKPSQDMADHLLRTGGSITGNATCPKCYCTSSQKDVYSGKFDVAEKQITCSNCYTNFCGPKQLFAGKPCPVCGSIFK